MAQTHVIIDSPIPVPVTKQNRYTVSLWDPAGPVLNANGVPIVVRMAELPRVGDMIAMDGANHVRQIQRVQYRNIDEGDIRVLVSPIRNWTDF